MSSVAVFRRSILKKDLSLYYKYLAFTEQSCILISLVSQ